MECWYPTTTLHGITIQKASTGNTLTYFPKLKPMSYNRALRESLPTMKTYVVMPDVLEDASAFIFKQTSFPHLHFLPNNMNSSSTIFYRSAVSYSLCKKSFASSSFSRDLFLSRVPEIKCLKTNLYFLQRPTYIIQTKIHA